MPIPKVKIIEKILSNPETSDMFNREIQYIREQSVLGYRDTNWESNRKVERALEKRKGER